MITIEKAEEFTEADILILTRGLDANAKQKRGLPPMDFFAYFLRDDDNKIVGGCYSLIYYGCLYIDQLWIDEKFRGQDFGTKLVKAAEEYALSKGCLFSTMETMDWEALEFYKKLGYYKESEQHGYVNGIVMYRMRKDF